jgi:hypothetical protein
VVRVSVPAWFFPELPDARFSNNNNSNSLAKDRILAETLANTAGTMYDIAA